MIKISGLYEVAIKVRDLARAEAFYRDVLGLEVGRREDSRKWVFLRAGGSAGMIVLQEDAGQWPQQHFAFSVSPTDLDRAVEELGVKGVPLFGPIVHDWIPARSVYFADPDGHDLELCTPGSNVIAITSSSSAAGA